MQKYFLQLTEMMEWLQRLKRARSSPAPGASMPTDENKSAEKNMSFAEKSSVFTAKASFNHSMSSVAAMKITLFGFSKSFLKIQFQKETFQGSLVKKDFQPEQTDCPPIVFSINVAVRLALTKFVSSPLKNCLISQMKNIV